MDNALSLRHTLGEVVDHHYPVQALHGWQWGTPAGQEAIGRLASYTGRQKRRLEEGLLLPKGGNTLKSIYRYCI